MTLDSCRRLREKGQRSSGIVACIVNRSIIHQPRSVRSGEPATASSERDPCTEKRKEGGFVVYRGVGNEKEFVATMCEQRMQC